MTDTLAIALAQLNPTVGDIDGNAAQVRRARAEAKGQGADLVICSELNICGYPPEDLVLKPAFQERCEAAVRALAAETADGGPALLIGSPWRNDGKLHNAAALLADGGSRQRATNATCRTTACSTRSASSCRARRRGP
jgi:NAD+ synthase